MRHEDLHRTLKRLLANGPLTAVPKRPSDQELLVNMAALQFDPDKSYGEKEVNEKLRLWLQTFCEPFGIDHVTLRRLMVDSRAMSRTKSGSTYRVSLDRIDDAEGIRTIEPAHVLAEIRDERKSRKRQHAA